MNKEVKCDNFKCSNADSNHSDCNHSCCDKSSKKTFRTPEEQKRLINRLNRIEGQIRGIRRMIEKDAYCADILIQSAAVSAAIDSFNKNLISNHVRTCVIRDIKNGKDDVADELVSLLQKLMR